LALYYHAFEAARLALDGQPFEVAVSRVYLAGAAEKSLQFLQRQGVDAGRVVLRLARALANDTRLRGLESLTELAESLEGRASDELAGGVDELLEAMSKALVAGPQSEDIVLLVQGESRMYDLAPMLEGPGRRLITAYSAEAALAAIVESDIDLAVLDLDLPDLDGREFLVRYWERAHGIAIPLFIVSNDAGSLTRLECLALGADAFFGLPLDGAVVAAMVSRALEQRRANTIANRYDPATGLGNRAAFADAFRALAEDGERRGPRGTLAILEINVIGSEDSRRLLSEQLIRVAGRRITRELGDEGIVARLGGNELGVLLNGGGAEDAVAMLDRIRHQVAGHPEETDEGMVSLSFYGSVVELSGNVTLREAMSEADRRLQVAKAHSEPGIVSVAAPRVTTRKIMLTEDDPLMARLTVHRLEREGYEVVHFDNGTEAFEAVTDVNPDLLVLDINMPGLDGISLLERIRSDPVFEDTPILMLTARTREADIVRAFRKGASDYLTKPFSAAELVARVGNLFARRGTGLPE
jgi:diguanylate cyclase (GGDEF)-like protein